MNRPRPDRRSAVAALGSMVFVSPFLHACGSGSGEDEPDLIIQEPAPSADAATGEMNFTQMKMPGFTNQIVVMRHNASNTEASAEVIENNGIVSLHSIVVRTPTESGTLFFSPDGMLERTVLHDGTTFLYQTAEAGSRVLIVRDATGRFLRGYALVASGIQLLMGEMTSETFTGLPGLTNVRDVGEQLGKYDLLLHSSQSLSLRRWIEGLFPPAHAQALRDDPVARRFFEYADKNRLETLITLAGAGVIIGTALYPTAASIAALGIVPTAAIIAMLALLAYSKKSKAAGPEAPRITGRFGGDDSGTFDVRVQPDGTVTGSIDSVSMGSAVVSGRLAGDRFTAAAGTVTTGADFEGTFSGLELTGRWVNTGVGESGTFRGAICSVLAPVSLRLP